MKAGKLFTFAVLAALAAAAVDLPAQQRDRRDSRDRDRDGRDSRSSSLTSTQPAPPGYLEAYAIIEKNNVFVRDRSRPAPRNGTTAPSATTRRSVEESLVVRGIAMEEVGYRAYVEDLNTSSTLRVSIGDPLGRGTVAAVVLDAIAYEHDGKQTWIEIGCDLTGKPSPDASPAYAALSGAGGGAGGATTSPTTSPTTLPANIDLNDPSLTVEQRMRLRVQLLQQQRGR